MSGLTTRIKGLGGRLFENIFPLYPRLKNAGLILMYHRVLKETPKGIYDPGLFVTERTFEMHIKEISKSFEIIPLENIFQSRSDEKRRCAITFDDGWIDNYEVAFPVLRKFSVPATIFIPAAMVGSNRCFWFENLWHLANEVIAHGLEQIFIQYFHDLIQPWNPPTLSADHLSGLTSALKGLPAYALDDLVAEAYGGLGVRRPVEKTVMDWDQIAEMGQHGITFGSHGMNHSILHTLGEELKRKDILESLELIKKKCVAAVPYFSFPNGDWDESSLAYVSEGGYRGGLTTKIGYNTSGTNPFLLTRIGLHEYISHSPELFWFRIFQAVLAGPG